MIRQIGIYDTAKYEWNFYKVATYRLNLFFFLKKKGQNKKWWAKISKGSPLLKPKTHYL